MGASWLEVYRSTESPRSLSEIDPVRNSSFLQDLFNVPCLHHHTTLEFSPPHSVLKAKCCKCSYVLVWTAWTAALTLIRCTGVTGLSADYGADRSEGRHTSMHEDRQEHSTRQKRKCVELGESPLAKIFNVCKVESRSTRLGPGLALSDRKKLPTSKPGPFEPVEPTLAALCSWWSWWCIGSAHQPAL
jgi:hypothetical protein